MIDKDFSMTMPKEVSPAEKRFSATASKTMVRVGKDCFEF